jgi:maltooligosyltrehalose trehalohydrolase
LTGSGVEFRVWAPDHERIRVIVDDVELALEREDDGHFRASAKHARAGSRYRFRLDDEQAMYPDPASRFQPEGPHGPSEVVDSDAYEWRDRDWPGIVMHDLVIYEMHVGTFTTEGTWSAAIEHLEPLVNIGINVIEVMPVNEFPGRFGWGYDGVDLFAPTRLYGKPDDFRRFVDAAHARGLGVILDVVYNHFGPDGCYLKHFAKDYFTDRYSNEWGDAINFDAAGVREFFCENAAYWIDEFHLDGLRLDATQSIEDRCRQHIVTAVQRAARAAAGDRTIIIVAENEPQDVRLIREYGVDAMWNDDWHHAAMVAATGRREAYYFDYRGAAQEFVSAARNGFLFQGQRYAWQKKRRGSSSRGLDREKLVCYLQNHDQVANSGDGQRLDKITSRGKFRALTALLLLGPNTPMLYQGQEFAASAPFLYFADHNPELAAAVEKGRRQFMQQFPSIDIEKLPKPHDPATFALCKLDHSEREKHAEVVQLHRDLIRLRRDLDFATVDGATLSDRAFVLRYSDSHLLLINLGPRLELDVAPEPLLAPPIGSRWQVAWSSEPLAEPIEADADPSWRIPGEVAVLLRAK